MGSLQKRFSPNIGTRKYMQASDEWDVDFCAAWDIEETRVFECDFDEPY